MQSDTWSQQSLFYFSKRVVWRWRWTFATIFAVIGLYFYDTDAGIIIWSILAIAAFLIIWGLLVFISSAKLIAIANNGICLYDSGLKDGKILINWQNIESISTQKNPLEIDDQQQSINSGEEPWSIYFQLTHNPFLKEFYPSNFLWHENKLILELNTAPKQGFAPLLKLIHQYRPRILKLYGFSLNTIKTGNLFSIIFAFFYDLILWTTISFGTLIIIFYYAFESGDALERIKYVDRTELNRLQREFQRRFLSGKPDFSIKIISEENYQPVKRTISKSQIEPYQFPNNISKHLLFQRNFKNPPHIQPAWQPGMFSLNALFSWSNEAAYNDSYSLKIQMFKKKIGEPDTNTTSWISDLQHTAGNGYLIESYVLTADIARSSLKITFFDAQAKQLNAFTSPCAKLAEPNQWFFTQYKVEAKDIPPTSHSIRFAVQQCIEKDYSQVGTLYYDAIKIYALKNGN